MIAPHEQLMDLLARDNYLADWLGHADIMELLNRMDNGASMLQIERTARNWAQDNANEALADAQAALAYADLCE